MQPQAARLHRNCAVITLEAAGSLLLVCTGLAILVLVACAAMMWARTKIAPHSDCEVVQAGFTSRLEDLEARLSKRQKRDAADESHKSRKPAATRAEEHEEPAVETVELTNEQRRALVVQQSFNGGRR